MLRADRPEVTAVQRDDELRAKTFGQDNHRGVGTPERKVRVLFDQLADPKPVLRGRRLDIETLESTEKTGLSQ